MYVFPPLTLTGFYGLYPDAKLKEIDCMFPSTYTLGYDLRSDLTYHGLAGNLEIRS